MQRPGRRSTELTHAATKTGAKNLHTRLVAPDDSHAYVSAVQANIVFAIDLKKLGVTAASLRAQNPKVWLGW